jgi:hypothetical protein
MIPKLTPQEYAWWQRTGMLPEWARRGPRVDTRTGRKRKDTRKNRKRPPGRDKRVNAARVRHPKEPKIFLGIDGEGQTNPVTGRHIYTFLAVSSADGSYARYVKNPKGLSTEECLQFIASIPQRYKLFAYSFGYDLTKILQDVEDQPLYRLLRPELRRSPRARGGNITNPVYWPAGTRPRWSFDYLNGQLKLKKCVKIFYGTPEFDKAVTIFDIWRFFQGKFTGALEDWKVPSNVTADERALILKNMRDMKDKRSSFDKMEAEQVEAYCFEECRYMAELAEKLTQAHIDAEIPLRSYYGAGSSASAMLDKMGIRDHVEKSRKIMVMPDGLERAIACGFTGGRFENSVIGAVEGPLWSYDISSAYPYQTTFLPCLIHGKWELTSNRRVMENARTAIVYYKLHKPEKRLGWGPFPYRFGEGREKGSIAFPESGQTGWVWREEFLAGERLFPNAEFLHAWVYHCECDCQPFKDIPKYYRQRLAIGKEGPGIVLKLGTNSCYGKTAQFIGGEPGLFTSWIWAGLITSGCRAQILDAMALHKDLNNLLMIATDGIASRERLPMPIPRNTGTFDCVDEKGLPANKPLGGWEEKELKKGLFLARPGIYFPLRPTKEEIMKVRARGIGRASVYEQWEIIVKAYESKQSMVHIKDLSRFIGAKSAIGRTGKGKEWKYRRSEDYGQWITRPVKMGFSPFPKRCGVNPDNTLQLRTVEGESAPYRKGVISKEAKDLIRLAEELAEQPDGGDFSEYTQGGDFDLVSG